MLAHYGFDVKREGTTLRAELLVIKKLHCHLESKWSEWETYWEKFLPSLLVSTDVFLREENLPFVDLWMRGVRLREPRPWQLL